jgi:hypothetical protein
MVDVVVAELLEEGVFSGLVVLPKVWGFVVSW